MVFTRHPGKVPRVVARANNADARPSTTSRASPPRRGPFVTSSSPFVPRFSCRYSSNDASSSPLPPGVPTIGVSRVFFVASRRTAPPSAGPSTGASLGVSGLEGCCDASVGADGVAAFSDTRSGRSRASSAEVRSTAKVLEVEGELVAGLVANCPTHSRRGSVEDPALASRLARNPPRICDTCDSVTHIVGASLGVSSKARGKET